MDSKLKSLVKQTLDELKNLEDKLEDWVDDLPDDTDEIRAAMKNTMGKIHGKLSESIGHGGKLSDEAELQAHLGLMEARDKMNASKELVDNYLESATEKSKTLMGEMEVKANLARMEAEDFWEERGPQIKEDFQKSNEKMVEIAGTTAAEIQHQLSKWNKLLNQKQ